jgi:hypothetical protein
MSSIFLAGLAASASDLNEPECEPSRSAKSTPIAEMSSPSIGLPPSSTLTSPSGDLSKAKLMSSRRVSPARTFHTLEKVPALPEHVRDSTGTSFEPFAWYDQDSRCWRTFQRCLVEGWTRFSGTWPRSGMTRNGIAFQRVPLVPLTEETASGLLPTPEASNTKAVALRSAGRSPRNFLAPIPTPTAKDTTLTQDLDQIQARRERQKAKKINGNGFGMQLGEYARRWPTPVARDYKGQGMSVARREAGRPPDNLCSAVQVTDGSGSLNPTWVEWLMGFPLGWTDLGRLATRSSRKSRKSSGEQS